MKAWIEKIYVLFMLMRIARHNKIRMKFEKKYEEVFDDYGQDVAFMEFIKCYERNDELFKVDKNNKECVVAKKPQRDDFGLYEYVEQHCGYCEDEYYGTIYTKTPVKNIWIKRDFHC